jgi:hypothetical protein
MLDDPGDSAISLLGDSPTADALLGPMLASKRPVLRAMAVFAHGARGGQDGVAVCRKAVGDAEPWIRRAAVVGLARGLGRMEEREALLGPFLRDESREVVRVAVIALLTPELRNEAGARYELRKFRYGGRVDVYASTRSFSAQRPPSVLPRRPSFLAAARKLFDSGPAAEDDAVSLEPVLALLLAQYGDFEPFHAYARKVSDARQISSELVAGISLSRDPRYLPAVRSWIEKSKDISNVQCVLKALRGMEGEAARGLRREANRRLRQLGGT